VLKVVREPLILLGGGAELKSYASGGQTLLLLAVVPAFGWLQNRASRIRLMTTMQLIFMGCLVAFYFLYKAEAPIGLAFYLWLGIFNVLVVSNFWSYANDLYTEEEGKRLFAVIGVGASIGAILGAYVPHLLNDFLGTDGLMMLAVIGLGASIVIYRTVDIRERAKKAEVVQARVAKVEPPKDKKGGFSLVMRDKYLRTLALMLLVATIINTTGEYVIGEMATEQSASYAAEVVAKAPAPTPDPAVKAKNPTKVAQDTYLKKFYSSYYFWVNLLSFVLQVAFVGRIMLTLGVRKALFIMPLIVLGGWFALILFVSMTPVRIEKTAENSLDYSLHNTLRQALFLPTSAAAKYKAKAAIDTFFFRLGDVIAGLGLVFLFVEILGLGVRAFAVMNVGLAVWWIYLAGRAGRLHDKLVAEQQQ
jgi:AAA family ATP:ADP antiporter